MAFFEYRTNPMYVQGPDALLELKRYCYHLGSKFLILTGCGPITDTVVGKVKQSFDNPMSDNVQESNTRAALSKFLAAQYDKENKPISYEIHDFEGKQVTYDNIKTCVELAKKMEADVLIAIGGGKVLDLVRGAYMDYPCQVVLCPTAAATNAPASTLAVIYTEEGDLVEAKRMDLHPALVISDTKEMIKAPAITLAAGMGDCMGTYYEGRLMVRATNREHELVAVVETALHLPREVFYEYGFQAVVANKNGLITKAYESVLSQIVHTPGPMSVIQSVHIPHLIDELLLYFDQCKRTLHGLLVGFGVISAMVWGGEPLEDIYEYIDFARSIGIPVTLEEVGVANEPKEKFIEAAEAAAKGGTTALVAEKISADDLWRSLFAGEEIVQNYLAGI